MKHDWLWVDHVTHSFIRHVELGTVDLLAKPYYLILTHLTIPLTADVVVRAALLILRIYNNVHALIFLQHQSS